MKKILIGLACLISICAFASEPSEPMPLAFITGNVYHLRISTCKTLKQAEQVVASEKISSQDGTKKFQEIDDCTNDGWVFRIGRVVSTTEVARGDMKIVEIETGDKAKRYWVGTMVILASVKKPGTKSSTINTPIKLNQI